MKPIRRLLRHWSNVNSCFFCDNNRTMIYRFHSGHHFSILPKRLMVNRIIILAVFGIKRDCLRIYPTPMQKLICAFHFVAILGRLTKKNRQNSHTILPIFFSQNASILPQTGRTDKQLFGLHSVYRRFASSSALGI
jgi:hypothetical protein